ncbi:MAG: metallophosphoesterase [Candidatus Hodarchaeota archaeon]
MKKLEIVAISDIHVDINNIGSYEDGDNWVKFKEKLRKILSHFNDIDLLVCAGDISPSVSELQRTLEFLTKSIEAEYYVFVPGNHDIWEVDRKLFEGISQQKYEKGLREAVNHTKFRYLPTQPLIIEDKLGLIGNIGWYDYSFRNPKWDDYLRQKKTWYYAKVLDGVVWNDVNYTDWGMHDLDATEYLINQLKEDYQKIRALPYKAAVLHHVPFREGVVYKDIIRWDFFSAFMGAACFGDLLQQWKVDLVIHGHTHFPQTYQVKSCRVYCAPIGYPSEWGFEGLNSRIKVFVFP